MNNGPVLRTQSSIALANLESTGRASAANAPDTRPPSETLAPPITAEDTLESLMEAGRLRRQHIEHHAAEAISPPRPPTPLQPQSAVHTFTLPQPHPSRRRISRFIYPSLATAGALTLGSIASLFSYAAIGTAPSHMIVFGLLSITLGMVFLLAGIVCWPTKKHIQTVTELQRELHSWHESLGLAFSPRQWHQDNFEEAVILLERLDRIRDTIAQSDQATRQQVLSRVRYVLSALDESSRLRQGLFEIATSMEHSSADPISWGLSTMEIMVRNWHAPHSGVSSSELFQIARGMYRIETIRRLANELEEVPANVAERLNPDEVASELQYGLRDRLSLPINVSQPRHELQLLPTQIEIVGDAVLAMEHNIPPDHALHLVREQQEKIANPSFEKLLEIDKNNLALYIAKDFEPWRSQVNRTAAPEIRALKEQATAYQVRLDDLPEDAAISEQDYLVSTNENMFLHNHGVSYKKALMAMLEHTRTAHAQ